MEVVAATSSRRLDGRQSHLAAWAGRRLAGEALRTGFAEAAYSLCGPRLPTRPFFGDTHLHTSFSMDAGAFGAGSIPAMRTASPGASR